MEKYFTFTTFRTFGSCGNGMVTRVLLGLHSGSWLQTLCLSCSEQMWGLGFELDCWLELDMDVIMWGLVSSRVKVVSPTTAMATNITKLSSLYHSPATLILGCLHSLVTIKVGSRNVFHHWNCTKCSIFESSVIHYTSSTQNRKCRKEIIGAFCWFSLQNMHWNIPNMWLQTL